MSKHGVAIPPPGATAKTGLFHGSVAWFSEGVSDTYKHFWKVHGGEIGEAEKADYLFAMAEDAPDVQEVSRRLGSKDHVFLCPRYIVRCVLIGRFRSPTKQHILGSQLPPASAKQLQRDNTASTSGSSQSSVPVNGTVEEADHRVHLMPSAGHEFCAAIAEKLLIAAKETK
ncbi:hypothetical protein MTO96_034626 [Rhipicephalus appendiculatus]